MNYKVNFGSPSNRKEGDSGEGEEFNLQAMKNLVPDHEKIRTMKMEIC